MNDDVIQSGAPNPWRSRGAAAALVAGGLLAGPRDCSESAACLRPQPDGQTSDGR